MIKHTFIHALHKTGTYGIIDRYRDHSEFVKARRRSSFSQFGEDLFLKEYFAGRQGVYIEIGGNHPFSLSNTYLLYRMGWKGLVVEPIARLHAKHRRFRPRDVQVNAAVGDSVGTLTLYEMIPSVLSTCELSEVARMLATGRALMLRKYRVPVTTVAELYSTYLAPSPISLLSIDTEGHDLAVLRGIDWHTMLPELIVCEISDEAKGVEIDHCLAAQGYKCIKILGCNHIFEIQREGTI
jgi:FkbM family methyltransferase